MSNTAALATLDYAGQVARVLRSNTKTEKFVAEQSKLQAETLKVGRGRMLTPLSIGFAGMAAFFGPVPLSSNCSACDDCLVRRRTGPSASPYRTDFWAYASIAPACLKPACVAIIDARSHEEPPRPSADMATAIVRI